MKEIKEINLKFVNSVTFSSTPLPSIFNKLQILYIYDIFFHKAWFIDEIESENISVLLNFIANSKFV